MKHIIIIGGGFAGVAAGLHLQKTLKGKEIQITLIDKNFYHLFTPSLYEVATSEVPLKNITIPLSVIFPKEIDTLKDEVTTINMIDNTISLKEQQKELRFDYLIIAIGSEPAYMHIPGLEEHSVGLKSIQDAVAIKNKIVGLCRREDATHKKMQLVIGGGGFAGTELAAELLTYKNKLAEQHHLDRDCMEVTVIQGSNHLLKELDPHVSKIAEKRVHFPNVHLAFGGHIKKVTKTDVLTDDGKSYPYDLLIWTGGVTPNRLAQKSNLPVTDHGAIKVNHFLQMEGTENIFAVGDVARFLDPKTQKPVPNVAQVAEEQGAIAGENIARLIRNKKLKPYPYRHFGYIVPLRGRFAVAELMFGIHFDGFLGWLLQQLVFLRYLLGILPIHKALKRWNTFEQELKQ
ncbi:MAG TPA: FAD-dependent oxidoreductase [Patescibacteria group bacterium]|nr:FAD-dependent oxidoreductase [Patescibacteria group bacterium]